MAWRRGFTLTVSYTVLYLNHTRLVDFCGRSNYYGCHKHFGTCSGAVDDIRRFFFEQQHRSCLFHMAEVLVMGMNIRMQKTKYNM
jgi:hypothetical protein